VQIIAQALFRKQSGAVYNHLLELILHSAQELDARTGVNWSIRSRSICQIEEQRLINNVTYEIHLKDYAKQYLEIIYMFFVSLHLLS
jgi:hypothetical protein